MNLDFINQNFAERLPYGDTINEQCNFTGLCPLIFFRFKFIFTSPVDFKLGLESHPVYWIDIQIYSK